MTNCPFFQSPVLGHPSLLNSPIGVGKELLSPPPSLNAGTGDERPSSPAFLSLPEEIIIMIAECLISRKDQLAFIKTCRAFQNAGIQTLYAHIDVRRPSPKSQLVLATLYRRPELAKYIRSYRGSLHLTNPTVRLGDRYVQRKCEIPPEGYFPVIFKHASAVRELEMDVYYRSFYGEETLATISQMPLTKLIIHEGINTLAATQLFHVQRSIRHLELLGTQHSWNLQHLTEDDLPNLESLSAPVGPAKFLVPGRPVKSVKIHFERFKEIEQDIWINLSRSSTSLLTLELSPFVPREALRHPAYHLLRIRHLRLVSCSFTS